MAKIGILKFKKGGIEFEYVGEPSEIEQLIQKLANSMTANTPAQTHFSSSSHQEPNTATTIAKLEKPKPKKKIVLALPPDEEVKKYMMSKPDFTHDIADIQRHFFGNNFKSRGETQSMYHRTSRQVIEIREKIEHEENGEFTPFPIDKNLIQYVFKKKQVATTA